MRIWDWTWKIMSRDCVVLALYSGYNWFLNPIFPPGLRSRSLSLSLPENSMTSLLGDSAQRPSAFPARLGKPFSGFIPFSACSLLAFAPKRRSSRRLTAQGADWQGCSSCETKTSSRTNARCLSSFAPCSSSGRRPSLE